MNKDSKVTIVLDAMGGDNAPDEIISGALMSLQQNKNLDLILVGPEELLKSKIKESNNLKIVNASEVISNNESPAKAVRGKPDSSLIVGLRLVNDGKADGFISAGSTGAILLASTIILKKIPGISRPTLGAMLPTVDNHSLLVDSGANVDCKANMLQQFAKLGYIYMQSVAGVKDPRVALVNVGIESEKGNSLSRETYKLLENSKINFIGNIEARDIPYNKADIIVCDGFVGNVILKYTEGFAKTLFELIKHEATKNIFTSFSGLLIKPLFKNIKKRFDYREVGGAPLLGLSSIVIKTHGSSDALTIKSAVNQCILFVRSRMIEKVKSIL
jgi:glycerol-3-phosphate acyltransferase PlsX